MEIGLVLPNTGSLAAPESILAIAERAEALGFTALWTADHLVLPIDSATSYPYMRQARVRPDARHPILDPMIVLAGVATRTKRIRLGVSVYLAALRHPIVAAKLVASLDRLSAGRVILGVGAGWIPEEYETMGIRFGERGRVLDEHIAAMRTLFEQEAPVFEGPTWRFDNLGFEPKPLQPRLPIWIGGNSAPARRRAARLGDGWHVIDVPPPDLERGIAKLAHACDEAGRDPAEVAVSMRAQLIVTKDAVPDERRLAPLVGPAAQIREDLERLRAAGVAHLALWPAGQGLDGAAYLERMDQIAEEITLGLAAAR